MRMLLLLMCLAVSGVATAQGQDQPPRAFRQLGVISSVPLKVVVGTEKGIEGLVDLFRASGSEVTSAELREFFRAERFALTPPAPIKLDPLRCENRTAKRKCNIPVEVIDVDDTGGTFKCILAMHDIVFASGRDGSETQYDFEWEIVNKDAAYNVRFTSDGIDVKNNYADDNPSAKPVPLYLEIVGNGKKYGAEIQSFKRFRGTMTKGFMYDINLEVSATANPGNYFPCEPIDPVVVNRD